MNEETVCIVLRYEGDVYTRIDLEETYVFPLESIPAKIRNCKFFAIACISC